MLNHKLVMLLAALAVSAQVQAAVLPSVQAKTDRSDLSVEVGINGRSVNENDFELESRDPKGGGGFKGPKVGGTSSGTGGKPKKPKDKDDQSSATETAAPTPSTSTFAIGPGLPTVQTTIDGSSISVGFGVEGRSVDDDDFELGSRGFKGGGKGSGKGGKTKNKDNGDKTDTASPAASSSAQLEDLMQSVAGLGPEASEPIAEAMAIANSAQ